MHDLHTIFLASVIAPIGIAFFNFGLQPRLGLPYSESGSVWLLEAICSMVLLAGSRFLMRSLSQFKRRKQARPATDVKATLVVGAGDAGAMVMHEILRDPGTDLKVVGFVDDNVDKHGGVLLGAPVLGGRERIPELVRQYAVSQIIIAMPTAPGKVIREVMGMCERVNISPRVVPSLHAIVDGSMSLSQLRPVDLEDLLRRDSIHTDNGAVRNLIVGRTVLVTGGGGSIGSELCRQILQCEPAELIVLGHGENSIFEIEQELRTRQQMGRLTTKITTCIADIRMAERIRTVFFQHRPEIVFHAAAHKHVPLMEANPGEAITNNIVGTQNVLNAALATNLDHFVMISSDKAVNPTSVMGATKRGAEMLVLDAARRSGKCYVAVRFGNVLGSRGSVVLTFKQQIAAGGPVTVTHPEVERFFMTIPEAVQLVLQAAAFGKGGEIFMLDMGEPVRILDLARDLIRLSGLKEGGDIDIEFTGMRPGEKMYEDLFLPGEDYRTTGHPKVRIAVNAGRYVPRDLHEQVLELGRAAQSDQRDRILQLLRRLVPEYGPVVPPILLPEPPRVERAPRQPEFALTQLNGGTTLASETGPG
ncbi:MAG: polysaccharide biosynthesis protein [Caldilineaceae bacterium]|nr:polysaccharide biosynthesis protein [Caldilineaceae bacterium]